MSNSNAINLQAQQGVFRFILKSKAAMQSVTRAALIKIGERLVYYSVVGEPAFWKRMARKGYQPGHFINNWQLGVDVVPVGEIAGVDRSGEASIERMKRAIPRWPLGHVYTFTNNVRYARSLEYGGHSLQTPPGGMIGSTVAEFPQIVREAEIDYAEKN